MHELYTTIFHVVSILYRALYFCCLTVLCYKAVCRPLNNLYTIIQVTMQGVPLSGHQQSVMATLLPHTMVNSVKPEEQPTSYQVFYRFHICIVKYFLLTLYV